MNKNTNKFHKKFILLLALCLIVSALSFQNSFAESISYLDKCFNNTCFKSPNSVAISSDGSFILILDSGDSSTSAFIRKVEYRNGTFTNKEIVSLGRINPENSSLELTLSNDDSKALVFRKVTSANPSLALSIKLSDKSVTTIVSSQNKLTSAKFIDNAGSKLIAGTNDSTAKLLVLRTENDSIEKSLDLQDKPKGINVSPDLLKAVITYKGLLSQSLSIYDVTLNKITTVDAPIQLLFDIDELIGKDAFDLKSKKAVLSSFNGKHILHYLDITNNKLNSKLLSDTQKGTSISDISPDGLISITASVVGNADTKVYKYNLKTLTVIETSSFTNFQAIDVDIVPDQQKVLVLGTSDKKIVLKILNLNNLNVLNEYTVSANSNTNPLTIEPFGRYAIKPGATDVATITPPSSSGGCVVCTQEVISCPNGTTYVPQSCAECQKCVTNTSGN